MEAGLLCRWTIRICEDNDDDDDTTNSSIISFEHVCAGFVSHNL